MKSPDLKFTARFKEACKNNPRLPASQAGLGKAFGVSGTMIYAYRNAESLPGMETAVRIATKCGVSVEWLLTGRGSKYPVDASGAALRPPDISDELLLECLDRMRAHLIEGMSQAK